MPKQPDISETEKFLRENDSKKILTSTRIVHTKNFSKTKGLFPEIVEIVIIS